MSGKKQKVQVLLFLVTVCVILFSLLYIQYQTYVWDESLYLDAARKEIETSDGDREDDSTFLSIEEDCTQQFKDRHLFLLEAEPGGIEKTILQLISLLGLSLNHCYTVVLKQNSTAITYVERYFNLSNVRRAQINDTGFRVLQRGDVFAKVGKILDTNFNWTQTCYRCSSGFNMLTDQIQYALSSIRLLPYVIDIAKAFLDKTVGNEPPVAIHVQKTENPKYSGIDWYSEYINKSMSYLISRYGNLNFVFISKEIEWCKDNFQGDNFFFSPFQEDGLDLALISLCKYSILTTGVFGYTGAWLGQHKTVLYSESWKGDKYYSIQFFYPNFVALT